MSVYRCNTTKEFSIAFYVQYKKIELSHRIHLKLNLSDTHISWKWYLIGSLIPKINIHLKAYKKKTDSPKMSTVKNPTFTFDLAQIQVVSFQCNHLFHLNHKDIKYGLKIILKSVGFS